MLNTPDVVSDVAAATRLAVANARLQAEIRARVAQVDASRRRLVEAADEQRRQLERELRDGAERRLTHIAELLNDAGPRLAEVTAGLDAARAELRELARGIHPATLTDHGLHAALGELAARSPIPVQLSAAAPSWPAAVEAAAYFVCAEALTNVAKYAHASRIDIRITSDDTQLVVEIADDGIGGANPPVDRDCTGSPTASRRSAAAWRSTARPVTGRGSPHNYHCHNQSPGRSATIRANP